MTPDVVRMLDNRFALLFIRGERPVMDEKFDILRHPNVGATTDGHGKPYDHGTGHRSGGAIQLVCRTTMDGQPVETEPIESTYALYSESDLELIFNDKGETK